MKLIDEFLNQFTMYRLTLYFLIGLLFYALVLSTLSFLSYNPLDLLSSIALSVFFCYISNIIFAKIFKATTNIESVFITALILSLIISPKMSSNGAFIIIASVMAMAAKYFPTIEKRHIFNPAASAVAAFSLLFPEHAATWWVGTPWMFIPTIIGGYLLVRKTRREDMFFSFMGVYLAIISVFSVYHGGSVIDTLNTFKTVFLRTPVVFFSTIMLTEPLTSPTTKKVQKWYAALVAFLFATPQMRIFGYVFTPELALIGGNIFTYVFNPNYRLPLKLLSNMQLSHDTHLFTFAPAHNLTFKPGQYMEWTLPHQHSDSRGNRRYFSLSSSPTETTPMILVKFYTPSSSYKTSLMDLPENGLVIAASLAGDFTLPASQSKKLVFIAGGVGIAPFRSMVKYLIDTSQKRDMILIFINRNKEDILFSDLWHEAEKVGLKTYYILTNAEAVPKDWAGGVGHLDESSIKNLVPDYSNRQFYVSGPQLMVQNFENTLKKTGISKKHIVTDFFPGYSEKTG